MSSSASSRSLGSGEFSVAGRLGHHRLDKPSDNEALPPAVQEFKQRRVRHQQRALVAGGIVGSVLLGPLGGALGGFAAHRATKSIGRARQARLERSLATQNEDDDGDDHTRTTVEEDECVIITQAS